MKRDEPAEHGPLVLLVDDDPLVLLTAQRALERHGFRVSVANNASEALSILEDTAVELMLTDVLMPQMSGITLAKIVHARFPSLPVIFMSGFVGDHAIDLFNERNFIPKPFSYRHLVALVTGALSQDGPFRRQVPASTSHDLGASA
ncbi:MAG: response regulator [Deltaproteobacteria bacterium]|nr:response regulator [Deltaproteobacteria bacterium]